MKINHTDFSKGSVSSAVMKVAVPMIIAELVNLLYNMVDLLLRHLKAARDVNVQGHIALIELDVAQDINKRSLTKPIVRCLPKMVGLVTLNPNIELGKVKVNEIALTIWPRDKLL